MGRRKEEQIFLSLIRERGLLSPEQIEDLSAQQQAEARNGVRKSLPQLALEKHYLSEDDLDRIETAIWVESLPDRLGEYELVRLIGHGGMSAVFEACDVSLGKTVALKVLLPQFSASTTYLARFHRESRLAAKLSHPNAVQVFRAGCDSNIHFLVMEYVEGQSVASLLREHGPLDEIAALGVALSVAHCLSEAHQLGIIHRDVKPSNILLSKWGVVKLTDFGIAKQISDLGDEHLQRSITLGVVGTPQYMSPEQARGARDIDFRTDIYSLGASLYHMLVGSPPHEAQTPQETMYRVASTQATDARLRRPDLTEATSATMGKMMALEPGDRFSSFEELAEALESARRQAQAARGAATAPTGSPEAAEPAASLGPPAPHPRAESPRVGRILTTAFLVVAIGALLLLGIPRLKGCLADARPHGPAAPSDRGR